MADVVLSAELQARVDSFVNNLLAGANAADNTSTSVSNMSANISRNIANVNRTNLTQFTAALNAGTLSVQRLGAAVPAITRPLTVGSNQAANALQNLGRVAQDAPFGFIGIQNNLNPLLESFQRLRAETGSNGAAFRALGQSLLGPAGIGIALSVVSSAILIYQQYQQRANKATNDAKKVTEDYIATLETLRGVNLKGAENAQKEITDLNLLYGAYQNANLPLKARKEAYSELQTLYPEYFGNIKFEREATDKTKSAYEALSVAIIATARARAASDKITKNETRKLENEEKTVDLQKEQIKLRLEQNKVAKQGIEDISTSTREAAGLSAATKSNDLQGKINDNIQTTNNLKTDSNKLDEQNARLVGYVNDQLAKGAKLTGNIGGELEKALKKVNTNKLDQGGLGLAQLLGINTKDFSIDAVLKPINKITTGAEYALNNLRYQFNYTDEEISSFITNFGGNADKLLATTLALNKGLEDIVNNGIVNTFSGLGSAIGDALANGTNVAEAAGMALLSSLGGVLVQLGELAISTGVGILAVKTALKTLNPVVAIAAGVALVALGSIFKAKAGALGGGGDSYSGVKQVRGFASGGNNISPGIALVGEKGPELINIPTGASVYNNNRSMDMLAGMGGNNVVINGNFELGLEKLYVRLEQTGKKMGRKV